MSTSTTTNQLELRMRLAAALSEIGQLRLQLETNQKQQGNQHKEVSRSESPLQQRGEHNSNEAQTSTSTTSTSTERKLRMLAYEAGQLRTEVVHAEATSASLRNDVSKASAASTALTRRAHRLTRKIERVAKDSNEHSSALSDVLTAIGVSKMSGVSRFLAECRAVGRRLHSAVEAYRVDKGERIAGDGEDIGDLGEDEEEEDEEDNIYLNDTSNIENVPTLQQSKSHSVKVPTSPSAPTHSRRQTVSFAVPSPKTARAKSSEPRISYTAGPYSQQRATAPSFQQHKERDLFANSARSAIAELAAENASLNAQLSTQMARQAKLEAKLSDARAANCLKIEIDSALQSMRASLITAQRAAEEHKSFAERMQREKEALQESHVQLRTELNEARDLIRNLQLDLVDRDREVAELDAAATAAARAAANAAARTARNIHSHVSSKGNMLDLDDPSHYRSTTTNRLQQDNTSNSSMHSSRNHQTTSPKRAVDEQIEPKRLSASLSTPPSVKKTSVSSGFGNASMKQTIVAPPLHQTSQHQNLYHSQPASRLTTSLKVPTQTTTQYPQQQRVLKRTLSSSSSSSSLRTTGAAVDRTHQPARSSPVAGGRGGLQGYAPALTSPSLTSSLANEKSSTSHIAESQHREDGTASVSQDSSPTNSTSSTLSRDIGELIGRGAHLRASPHRREEGDGRQDEELPSSDSATNDDKEKNRKPQTSSKPRAIESHPVASSSSTSTTLASILTQEVSEAVISLAEQLHAMSVSTPPPQQPQRSAAKTREKPSRGGVSSIASPPPPVSPAPLAAIPRASDSQSGGVDMQALAEIRAGLTAVDEEIASMRAKVSAATSAAAAAAAKARNSNNIATNKHTLQPHRVRRDSSGLNLSIGSASTGTSLEVPDLARNDKVWIKLEEGIISPPDSLTKKKLSR
jgi:hypothetical protein